MAHKMLTREEFRARVGELMMSAGVRFSETGCPTDDDLRRRALAFRRGEEVVYRMPDSAASCGAFWQGDLCIVCETEPAGLTLFNRRSGELSPRGCDPAWFIRP